MATVNASTYEVIKRFAQRTTLNGLLGDIPLVIDEDRPPNVPMLTPQEVRICMADFVDFRRFAAKDDLGLKL
jgi:hypothetical protein